MTIYPHIKWGNATLQSIFIIVMMKKDARLPSCSASLYDIALLLLLAPLAIIIFTLFYLSLYSKVLVNEYKS